MAAVAQAHEEEQRRQQEAERLQQEEYRLQEERVRQEEQQRQEEERLRQEEQRKQEQERFRQEEQQKQELARLEEERARQDRERRAEAERCRQEKLRKEALELKAFFKENGFADANSPKQSGGLLKTTKTYALHIAAERGDAHIVELLLKQGVDTMQQNSSKKTAAQIAQKKNKSGSHDAVLRLLAGSGFPSSGGA